MLPPMYKVCLVPIGQMSNLSIDRLFINNTRCTFEMVPRVHVLVPRAKAANYCSSYCRQHHSQDTTMANMDHVSQPQQTPEEGQ